MNKRGQIFIAATLILLSIILGLRVIYSEVKVDKQDLRPQIIAQDLKQESLYTLTYAANQPSMDASKEFELLTQLAQNYSSIYPEMEIYLWFNGRGEELSHEVLFHEAQSMPDIGTVFIAPAMDRTAGTVAFTGVGSYRNIYYNTSINTKTNNLYVIIVKKGENGETVIAQE